MRLNKHVQPNKKSAHSLKLLFIYSILAIFSKSLAAIRYHDIFVKQNGKWLFANRKLYVDWIENR
jgi:hypothetical protein